MRCLNVADYCQRCAVVPSQSSVNGWLPAMGSRGQPWGHGVSHCVSRSGSMAKDDIEPETQRFDVGLILVHDLSR